MARQTKLDDRLRFILRARSGEHPKSLRRLSDDLKISRERVRQLWQRAVSIESRQHAA
ncbi:MAG: sigma factor-like helix-turn-helix DNA-binding protein [Terriglobia bacterium]